MPNVLKIAFHLPQFHIIEENNRWWGEGFTEWTNVKRAKPIYSGHYQPHVPMDDNYYDLNDIESLINQANIAKKFMLDGFCFYNYWFNGITLLEKPLDNIIKSNEYDFPFMLCWANENWTRRWDGKNKEILIEQSFENHNFSEHALYLSKIFSDNRYIHLNKEPVFMIYKPDEIPNLKNFIHRTRVELRNLGIENIKILGSTHGKKIKKELISSGIDIIVDFMPNSYRITRFNSKVFDILFQVLTGRRKYLIHKIFPRIQANIFLSYKKIVEDSINRRLDKEIIPCVFPSWDNTSRRRLNSTIIQNKDVKLFAKWFKFSLEFQIVKSKEENSDQMIFINAWNEWGEGCHLEPDVEMGFAFLETIKECVKKFE
jgi:lipopolysaccharide biosynthesis protein